MSIATNINIPTIFIKFTELDIVNNRRFYNPSLFDFQQIEYVTVNRPFRPTSPMEYSIDEPDGSAIKYAGKEYIVSEDIDTVFQKLEEARKSYLLNTFGVVNDSVGSAIT